MSHWFRGSDTSRHCRLQLPGPRVLPASPGRCAQPAGRARTGHPRATTARFVSGLPTDTVVFNPYPGVDLIDVYAFLDRNGSGIVGSALAARGALPLPR